MINEMTDDAGLRLDDQLCFALYAATNAVVRAYRPLLRQLNLTYPQYLVMLTLWQDGECSASEIARRLRLAPNAITPMVDRLEEAGLVERRPDLGDRRTIQIALTARGTELEGAAHTVQQAVVCQTGLTPDSLAALRHDLRALVGQMEVLQEGGAEAAPPL